MNKIIIGTIFETAMRNTAKELHQYFSEQKYYSEFYSRDSFPIGDAMFPLLYGISKKFDIAFILISNSINSSVWISKELRVQHSLGGCRNVYPIFLTEANIPPWWNNEKREFITMDNLKCNLINRLL